ncbi:MAG: tripeptide aminopeptidase PepT, partial [Faecalibacterium prausnitzii]|nr:tripeptide aminopeptidase PepT [Faecalibacterium prausnitzii]
MRAYERLLNYVRVHTTSDPESGTHPSAQREFDLAYKLAEELKALGVEDARVDEHCYVYGSLPATPGYEDRHALGLIAHMDTAPDASGENVNPILHEDYDGKDVVLPATGMVMKVSAFPFLASMKGETLITTDGTTLLGADDKAGVAEIMTAVEMILEQGLPHGKLCIAFTPDEEIGEGADLFDIPGFGADFAYTVDGGDAGCIEYENFNA